MDTQHVTPDDADPDMAASVTTATDDQVQERPAHIPEKFWDSKQGSVRTDALLKSYSELENRMGETPDDIPETPDQYDLVIDHQAFDVDTDTNARLHAAGFSREQAQLVYDLAKEKLLPLMENMTGSLERDAEAAKLKEHFGGQKNWPAISRQIGNWGRKQLPTEAFNALSSSFDGVMAMHSMMSSNEPTVLGNHGHASSGVSESDLKRMMQDPRYWRDQDPVYIDRVRQGFKTLYPA